MKKANVRPSSTKLWDIDQEIEALETGMVPGTMLIRVMMDCPIMVKEGIEPTQAQLAKGYGLVWCCAVGQPLMAKAFFYGTTIRAAVTAAKLARKTGDLYSSWGDLVCLKTIRRGVQ